MVDVLTLCGVEVVLVCPHLEWLGEGADGGCAQFKWCVDEVVQVVDLLTLAVEVKLVVGVLPLSGVKVMLVVWVSSP